MAFPNRVRVALDLLGVTQLEASGETGIHPSTMSQIVNGKHGDVKLDTGRRLAEYVGCAIEDLFPATEPQRASA
jgi:transcriptional regulator with XRE-family HTH domain